MHTYVAVELHAGVPSGARHFRHEDPVIAEDEALNWAVDRMSDFIRADIASVMGDRTMTLQETRDMIRDTFLSEREATGRLSMRVRKYQIAIVESIKSPKLGGLQNGKSWSITEPEDPDTSSPTQCDTTEREREVALRMFYAMSRGEVAREYSPVQLARQSVKAAKEILGHDPAA